MKQHYSQHLYIDLMKKTLCSLLWPEPPVPITRYNYKRPLLIRVVVTFISKLLDRKKLQIVKESGFDENHKLEGQYYPSYADTMVGLKRLDNLQKCIESVLEKNVEGDFIETGVWRGGACIFMRAMLAAYGVENRSIFVADSFEGLPLPDEVKYPADKGSDFHREKYLAVTQQEVENNFSKYGLLDDKVVFLKGWFEDTLPGAPIDKLSILRLDGDMYSSTIQVLQYLYPKLPAGGFCIIDDYFAVSGCQKAVDDYRAQFAIKSEMYQVDSSCVYWQK